MTVLLIMVGSLVVLGVGGKFYSGFIARHLGEDASRLTPAVRLNDGRDYVPSPTSVVFAHHFAAIAGAGPIIGPVIALVYGWVPALIWVVVGGLFLGSVHDYLALHMATREGGQSVATIARRLLGDGPFLALMLFLILMLALVCATFLNLSATALVSMLPFDRIEMAKDQTLFRIESVKGKDLVVIGGVASMSVIVLTVFAPLVGWMYIKRNIAVWKCSIVAMAICAVSILLGLYVPVALPAKLDLGVATLSNTDTWKVLLSVYVLVAAGVPVWMFLQSRDFINCHILYVGMGLLLLTLLVVGGRNVAVSGDPIPAWNYEGGTKALGWIWPALFITIACGAVSGFHSLCAGGTTCKQIKFEPDARRIGYFGMLLETFLAVSVIAVMLVGTSLKGYLIDVHPLISAAPDSDPNQVLGFAVATGKAANLAWGIPVAFGALAGMILLEGFLITTLDAAVRLTRYLVEEVWRMLFGRYDVFAPPVESAKVDASKWSGEVGMPAGSEVPSIAPGEPAAAPAFPTATSGPFRWVLKLLRQYWINSGIAVGLMLLFALTGGQTALWSIFATANQLLAAMVLSLASLWLLRQGKKSWFAFLPAVFMLATTLVSLVLLFPQYYAKGNAPLVIADVVIFALAVYLLTAGFFAAAKFLRAHRTAAPKRETIAAK